MKVFEQQAHTAVGRLEQMLSRTLPAMSLFQMKQNLHIVNPALRRIRQG